MRLCYPGLLQLFVCCYAKPQIGGLFGDLTKAVGKAIQEVVQPKTAGSVNTRLGLLANDLGLDPTADSGSSSSQQTADFTAGSTTGDSLSGRTPQQCCCEPLSSQCEDPITGPDLIGSGLINARQKNRTTSRPRIATRIVNRPSTNQPQQACPVGQKTCCYDGSIDLSVFGKTCINPQQAQSFVPWSQGCQERQPQGAKQCGTRNYDSPVSGLAHGQTSPGEFPWTCLLLNQNNDFIGTCALIPSDFTNNNNRPTRKVLTAAHKLKVLEATDLLKVRVGEYDASGFNDPETQDHEEYTVTRILKHPQMSNTRLSNDIAILYVERDINLNHPYVNTACLPSCDNMFDYQFTNGTGVRCYVAGWGKDEADGSFQFIPRKVDVPIVNNDQCQADLRTALNQQRPGAGNNFRLHPSEICAGAEIGKDACTGDGGSPLVCQAESGRWTVMGLVTWGVGCASDVPGVYARVSHFRNWINAN